MSIYLFVGTKTITVGLVDKTKYKLGWYWNSPEFLALT